MEPLRILLVGCGGRESALAHKLSQSNHVEKIHVAPGNGGTAQGLAKVSNLQGVNEEDFDLLVQLSKDLNVNLVVPGPDVPVVNGIEAHFRSGKYELLQPNSLSPYITTDFHFEAGIPCFAPSKAAAKLEGSKAFSKDFMARHNIPTAAYCKTSPTMKQ